MGKGKEETKQEMPAFQKQYLASTVLPFAKQVSQTPFEAYTGPMAPEMSGYTTQAAGMYGQAGAAGNYTPADWNALTQQNMSAYTQNVMDPTLALMNRERQKQMVGEQANIIGSGAFDSSRRGVFEGESSAAYGLGRDKMIADLNRQGYNEAQAATMSQFGAQQGALAQGAAGLAGIGGMETALSAAEIDAMRNEFMREQQDPYQKLAALQGGASAIPGGYGTTTSTKTPGLFDYLTLAASNAEGIGKAIAGGSDIRLKENVQPLEKVGGVQFYFWDWNDEGKKVAHKDQPTFGVIADELQETHPHLVTRGGDGYLRVNYVGLANELDG